eukprot:5939915-Pyramimonas_sp.AAC.1
MSSTATTIDYILCSHGGPRKLVRLHVRPGVLELKLLVYTPHARPPVCPPVGPRRGPRAYHAARELADHAAHAAEHDEVPAAQQKLNHAWTVFGEMRRWSSQMSDVLDFPVKVATRDRCCRMGSSPGKRVTCY